MKTFVEIKKDASGKTIAVRMFNDDGVRVRNDIYYSEHELWAARERFADEKRMGFEFETWTV